MIDGGEQNFKKIESMVAMAKCFASDVTIKVTTEAVQVQGRMGT
ncbi:MAG: hypothetical protein SWO11_14720 [Thermodesulfobacteriota bacterium]|nr:hypothetical protein [Thermodesulfobacteriota bacterium]